MTANHNATKKREGYRYDSDIKSYALYFRTLAGPIAYETVQRNMPCALPSLSSTNRYLQKTECRVIESIVRSQELLLFLNERNLEKYVVLSEDATRIVGRVQYDVKTNQIIGFVQPLSKENGLPIPFSFPARNAAEIVRYFTPKNKVSSFVNVIMAQPVGEPSSSFCLLLFGCDNKYTSEDVSNRWNFVIDELNKQEIHVLAVSSDSDPRYNAAMRNLSHLGIKSKMFGDADWFSFGNEDEKQNDISEYKFNKFDTVYVQDTTHIGTKMRNAILKTIKNETKFPFGRYYIKQSHLFQLISCVSKDKHNLTRSTLNPFDKQNFRSVKRMCNEKVIQLLRQCVAESYGTIIYLEIMSSVIDAYMDEELTPLQREYKIWYSVFMLRIWRTFVVSKKNLLLKNNFLGSNCYTCIEINAHSLVKCLIQLNNINKPHLFMPFKFESQACESLFRQIRSLTTTY